MEKFNDEKVRVNIRLSPKLKQFYEELGREMGIPYSSAMVMGLKFYMDYQTAMQTPDLLKQLQQIVDSSETRQ